MRQWIDLFENDEQHSDLVEHFMEGGCYSLAVAHWRVYGWPIIVIGYHGDGDSPEDRIISLSSIPRERLRHEVEPFHAMNLHPSGKLLDIKGLQSFSELKAEWPHDLVMNIGDEDRLRAVLSPSVDGVLNSNLPHAIATVRDFIPKAFPEAYR